MKLMWIARIARQGAIYDASEAENRFLMAKWPIRWFGNGDFPENEEKGIPESKNDFDNTPCFRMFLQANQSNVNKANILKKTRKHALYRV